MKIQTKYLGEVRVHADQVIQFPSGIPGFIEEEQFVLLNLSGDTIFQTLQSVTTPDLAFVVVNPFHFYKDYEFKLKDYMLDFLKITRKEDVAVLSILTLKDPFHQSTLNLKAPIIMNIQLNYGKQYVLDTDKYAIKSPLTPHPLVKMKGD